jgi:hypothetical protein
MTKSRGILGPRHKWTEAELDLLKREYPSARAQVLADACGVSLHVLYSKAQSLGLKKSVEFLASAASGRLTSETCVKGNAYRFPPGHKLSPNRGLRRPGYAPGRMSDTQFKKGRRDRKWVPIGTVRVASIGYAARKVRDTPRAGRYNRDFVHRLVWVEAHGPVPPGHVVCFRPGRFTTDAEKITVDALELVTKVEHLRRHSIHTNYPKEVRQLIQLKGAVRRVVNRRLREERNGRSS